MEQQEKNIRAQKVRLREQFRQARLSLSSADYANRSALICERLAGLPVLQASRVVFAYWPLEAKREVDLRPLLLALYGHGVRVGLPVVEGAGKPMRHRLFSGTEQLRQGHWGIMEPQGPLCSDPPDAVLVPAFGAGRNRHRIGHGAGFYDRFLATVQATTICPVYAVTLVLHIPHEPHDCSVDLVVTEDEEVGVKG